MRPCSCSSTSDGSATRFDARWPDEHELVDIDVVAYSDLGEIGAIGRGEPHGSVSLSPRLWGLRAAHYLTAHLADLYRAAGDSSFSLVVRVDYEGLAVTSTVVAAGPFPW